MVHIFTIYFYFYARFHIPCADTLPGSIPRGGIRLYWQLKKHFEFDYILNFILYGFTIVFYGKSRVRVLFNFERSFFVSEVSPVYTV